MTGTIGSAQRRMGAASAAALLAAVFFAVSAAAEQSDRDDRAPGVHRTVQGASKPATTRPRSTANAQSKPWTIEDALPDKSPAAREPLPDSEHNGLGRVPLRSSGGSIGFETESKFRPSDNPDSKHIPPGLDTADRQPQYLGLSLSVPTSGKSIIPSPLLPPWGKPE